MVYAYECIDVILRRDAFADRGLELIRKWEIEKEHFDDDLICVRAGMNPMDAGETVRSLEFRYRIKITDRTDPKHPKALDGAVVSGPFGLTEECDWLKHNSYGGWEMVKERSSNDSTIWNSDGWVEQFGMASRCRDGELLHGLRRNVFRFTKKVVQEGGYEIDGSWVAIGQSPASTWFCDELKVRGEGSYETVFEVVNEDCLATARRLAGENPLVLNMASRSTPGGGVEGGAGAQEECLFRSSNYYTTLYPLRDVAYPMDRNFGGIYSPEVTVFRGLEADGYPLLEEPFKVSFVAVAALNGPHLTPSGDYTESERLGMINKIRTILNIALKFGHKTLVLSAFGCGAFRNPPEKVALLFKEVFEEPAYKGAFEKVVFAIKGDHNDWHNANFEAFRRVFEPTLTLK